MNLLHPIPESLSIEPTSRCNSRCVICPRTHNSGKREDVDIDFDLCLDVVKQSLDIGVNAVLVEWIGEPTLHPRYTELIVQIRKLCDLAPRAVKLYHYTNGSKLGNPEIRKTILDNLDELRISIEGATILEMEKTRPGLNQQDIKEGVRCLWEDRKKRKAKKPKIVIRKTILPNKEANFVSNWKKYCDSIVQIQYVDFFNRKILNLANKPCGDVFSHIGVTATGNVVMCCRDYNEDVVYGNVYRNTLRDIFYGERATEIRKLHIDGKANNIERCARCTAPKALPVQYRNCI